MPLSSYGYDRGSGTVLVTGLTPRHRQLCRLVELGRSNAEIADELGISRSTVRNHLLVIYRVLGLMGAGDTSFGKRRALVALVASGADAEGR